MPSSLYQSIGLADVGEKLPRRILRIGEVAAGLSGEMAVKTGMRPGIPVVGGGADAYIGVIGVNALQPGKVALVTGSSQLLIGLSAAELHAPCLFGSFPDAILPGIEVVEAGQISTGSIIKCLGTNYTGGHNLYEKVDKDQGVRLVQRAVDLGITFIDTADIYGEGRSEELVAPLRQPLGPEFTRTSRELLMRWFAAC